MLSPTNHNTFSSFDGRNTVVEQETSSVWGNFLFMEITEMVFLSKSFFWLKYVKLVCGKWLGSFKEHASLLN